MATIYAPASISKGSRLTSATTPSHLLNVQEGVKGFMNGLIFWLFVMNWDLVCSCDQLLFSILLFSEMKDPLITINIILL